MPDDPPEIRAQKASLLRQLDAAHTLMDSALARVRDAQQIVHAATGWTVHDVAGHILAWDEETLRALAALHAGGDAYTISGFASFEDYNRRQYERLRAIPFDVLRDRLFATHERTQTLLVDLPPDAFRHRFTFPWPMTGTLDMLVQVMVAHKCAHAREIAAALDAGT